MKHVDLGTFGSDAYEYLKGLTAAKQVLLAGNDQIEIKVFLKIQCVPFGYIFLMLMCSNKCHEEQMDIKWSVPYIDSASKSDWTPLESN